MLDTVYSGSHRVPSALTSRPGFAAHGPGYDRAQLWKAWELLLECSDRVGHVDGFRFDLVNVARQALVNVGALLHGCAMNAYHEHDRHRFSSASGDLLQLFRDVDSLLATRQEFLLGAWLEDAKRWGTTEEERRRFEWNARNVITLWGDRNSVLHDYARREWSGLLTGFYLPRWRLFFDRLDQSLATDESFDSQEFTEAVRRQEEEWTHGRESYPAEPRGDSIALSRRLFDKYGPVRDRLQVRHLAAGKPATASAVYQQQTPDKAVDGIVYDRDSGWWADPYPQWLKVDLEKVQPVGGIHLYFYWDGQRSYQYTVEVSRDGNMWKEVVNERWNTRPATGTGRRVTFEPVQARFVRLNMLSNSANSGVHVAEIVVLEAGSRTQP
jgi:hypothetical protein